MKSFIIFHTFFFLNKKKVYDVKVGLVGSAMGIRARTIPAFTPPAPTPYLGGSPVSPGDVLGGGALRRELSSKRPSEPAFGTGGGRSGSVRPGRNWEPVSYTYLPLPTLFRVHQSVADAAAH